jgi:hypothetical protein
VRGEICVPAFRANKDGVSKDPASAPMISHFAKAPASPSRGQKKKLIETSPKLVDNLFQKLLPAPHARDSAVSGA